MSEITTKMKYMKLDNFAKYSGYTEKAIRRKIEEGVWLKDIHFKKAPDGRIHINIEEYNRWVEAA